MAFIAFFLIAIISINNLNVNYARNCTRFMTGQLNEINFFAMSHVEVYTLHECVRACKAESLCGAFEFRRSHGNCFLIREANEVNLQNFTGMVFSDILNWNVIALPCSGHTCAEDEYCYPTGANYVCKKANDVCYKQLPTKMCFKHFENVAFDFLDSHYYNLEITNKVRNAMGCATFCAKRQPNFLSLAYEANQSKCYCRNMTITDYLHRSLGSILYDHITVDMYFKV